MQSIDRRKCPIEINAKRHGYIFLNDGTDHGANARRVIRSKTPTAAAAAAPIKTANQSVVSRHSKVAIIEVLTVPACSVSNAVITTSIPPSPAGRKNAALPASADNEYIPI